LKQWNAFGQRLKVGERPPIPFNGLWLYSDDKPLIHDAKQSASKFSNISSLMSQLKILITIDCKNGLLITITLIHKNSPSISRATSFHYWPKWFDGRDAFST